MAIVTIRDETTRGETTGELSLEFRNERVTGREIIRSRIYQEVTEYNARRAGIFRGLVQPRDAAHPDRDAAHSPSRIDWEAQYNAALEAFTRNGFLLLVDDAQVTELDAEVDLRHDTCVSFLRLIPLIGG